MPLPRYLTDSADRIKNMHPQLLGAWNANYDNPAFTHFPIMIELKDRFPNKVINRSDIITLFTNGDKYLGFIAAMVWGFINASRPRKKGGDRTETNLYRVLSHPREKVVAAINNAEDSFKKNDYRTPFKQMMRGESHNIPGIDYPYFTKIFFFIGQASKEIAIKPLIFDKWTSNAFYALLSQSYPGEVHRFFRRVKDAKEQGSPGEVLLRSRKHLEDTYIRYVELMNCWAANIGVSPDKLEEFVFGYNLKTGDSGNPRVELWKIVDLGRQLAGRGGIKGASWPKNIPECPTS